MKRLIIAALALLTIASADPVADTRQIMAGTVSTASIKQAYLSGARDGTTAFKGALEAYRKVRAAEPPLTVKCVDGTVITAPGACPVAPPPPPPPPVQCPDGSTVPAGSVCPTPPPPPPPPPSTDFSVPADIADNFPTANGIEPYGVGLAEQGQLPPVSGDPVGAFRLACPGLGATIGQFDPMFFPGQAKAGHMHTFGVNSAVSASSTYATLRANGGGCGAPSTYALYRSAFWFPSMLDGAGSIVLPDYFNTYYKQLPASDPDCKRRSSGCVPLPNGLRFVEGWNSTTMAGGPGGWFECWIDDNQSQRVVGTGRTGSIDTLVAQGCGAGRLLVYQTGGPECWDGKNIDSVDHRSHVAYPNRPINDGGPSPRGNSPYGCPVGWYLIPQVSIREVWTTDANFAAGKWRMSCDDMTATKAAGSCGHFDYWEAWSPSVKATWQKFCIDGHKSCSGGDLGNGTQIKGLVRWPKTWTRHVLVPIVNVL